VKSQVKRLNQRGFTFKAYTKGQGNLLMFQSESDAVTFGLKIDGKLIKSQRIKLGSKKVSPKKNPFTYRKKNR